MIRIVAIMMWHRRGQAVTLALLSLLAVAAAVAAPAYVRAADRAVAAGQVATATPAERALTVSATQNQRSGEQEAFGFDDIAGALLDLPGFSYVYAAEYPTVGIEPTAMVRSRFVYRQDACAHLRMATGRCMIGEGEVVIGVRAAGRLSLTAGDPITLTAARFNPDPRHPGFLTDGKPRDLTVVGTYRVSDPQDTYWGAHGYFARDAGDRPGEPVFADAATLQAMDHGSTDVSVDGFAGSAALAVDHLGALRTQLTGVGDQAGDLGAGLVVRTRIPQMLDRIDAGRAAARLIVPVLAVPLVLLACLSIFLAVGYSTQGRRPELAVVALRGARRWHRWWLACGESLFAIGAGAVAGCLAGQLLVDAVAAWRFPGVGVDAGIAPLRNAPPALLAAVAAALLAQRRQIASPVADLLRRTVLAAGGGRALAVEAAVALVAVVTGLQPLLSGGSLTGVGMFAAGFVMLALALIFARLVTLAITRVAGRALIRGRLGLALAAFPLSRRPGAARLCALLVAAVAVAGYAACAVDVAARGRRVVAELGTGADRVLTMEPVGRQQLLSAVRGADPGGRYAMAVVPLPPVGAGEPSAGLAVDSTRLAAVAHWAPGGDPAGATARALRPATPAPVVIPGRDVTADITATGLQPDKPVRLSLVLSSVTGLGDTIVHFGDLRSGPWTYQQRVPVCRQGCRLNAVALTTGIGVAGVSGEVVLHGLRSVNPVRPALSAAALADTGRWRLNAYGRLTTAPDGLRIALNAPNGLGDGAFVQPVDTPWPLPVAWSGDAGERIAGFDGGDVPATTVAHPAVVPVSGLGSALVDMEYLDRVSTDASAVDDPQVWLAAGAPPGIVDALAGRGLVVVRDVRADHVRDQLDRQGPAIALWFAVLAAVLATALAAGALILAASVDRARHVADLRALRAQGLPRPPVRRATLGTYPALVVVATVLGLATALAGWGLTGWALPLAGLDPPPLPLPGWPQPPVLAATGAVMLAVLAVVAYAAGRRTLREVP
ncbi:FtsX-like permease family protein [Mangrovihabitans endophyticus]|uniref:ABC3 transporter permease C-terminal domain-containing protein n=1 Tax=Mangrovihabitans endophyticus TaxID=1751298 RepID=A0A8J3FNU1_9ACTN|nr:FtsX-like permease family protein [Mangrovihabitans endophyticus]GGK84272.1 hypothetical protein GCM10012284_18100 [Mangrovihabitans endophyticus]